MFGAGAWDGCVGAAASLARWALESSSGADEGDTDLKAIQFVSEWLERSAAHFGRSDDERIEPWGEVDRDPDGLCVWYVMPRVMGRALEAEGFDQRKTLRRMRDEGLLVVGKGRCNTRQRRFRSGRRVWCLCVDGGALEGFLAAGGHASPGAPARARMGDGAGDGR